MSVRGVSRPLPMGLIRGDRVEEMVEMWYNLNEYSHIKSSGAASTARYPFSTDVRGIDTMSDITPSQEQPQETQSARVPRGQTPERRAYMKAYNAANPRDRRPYKKAYDEAHKEENRAYREANQERLSAQHKAYYQANREQILARVKSYYEQNREKVIAYQLAYCRTNPDKVAERAKRRDDRMAANGGSHTKEELEAKFAEFGNVCVYCGTSERIGIDHMIPVVRGGTDNIENIVPACRSCNSRKNARTAEEFFAYLEEPYRGR